MAPMPSRSHEPSRAQSGTPREPPFTTRPLGQALDELLDQTGMPVEDLIKHLGRRWRFLRRGVANVDGRGLPAEELARLRGMFDLPPGYFIEEREAFVARELRREPELRDRLYFALIDKDRRQAARLAAAAEAPADPPEPEPELALVPLAPPTLRQLVLIVLDTTLTATVARGPRDEVDAAIARLLDELGGSQGSSNFAVAFVTYDEHGVASVPPAHPALIEDGVVEALWQSVERPDDADGDETGTGGPLLHAALDVAHALAEAFFEEPSDLPVSVRVLVISSVATSDTEAARAASARLEKLPAVSVIALSPVDDAAFDRDDVLIRHLKMGRSLDHAFG
jgi:hypothetical protein